MSEPEDRLGEAIHAQQEKKKWNLVWIIRYYYHWKKNLHTTRVSEREERGERGRERGK